jgi:fluoride exporter
MIHILLVGAGGFLGAAARYGVIQLVSRKFRSVIPLGTLSVNLLGSFLLGWIAALGHTESALFFGTGFMGAFTTFSTFKVEGIRLWKASKYKALILYYLVSYTAGIALAFLGYALGHING